ncbi:hypothetical protein BJ170DRAFT_124297 [Xylariales sp. AK1849]|nr:hypothetical protein BJ170DRAFT_124297 [Xylariales sp. AK1849]
MASASTLKMGTSSEGTPNAAAGGLPAPAPIVRTFKASDLPLTTATRSAIEGLAHSFKKQGGYDAIRKQVWDKFEASVCSLYYISDGKMKFLTCDPPGLRSPSYKVHPRSC